MINVLATIVLLLQLSITVLTQALTNQYATNEQKTQALAFSQQAVEFSIAYLEVHPEALPTVQTPATLPPEAIPEVGAPVPAPQNCSSPPDGRTKLNDEDRERLLHSSYFSGNEPGARELLDRWNSVALFDWFKNTIGWCEVERWEQ